MLCKKYFRRFVSFFLGELLLKDKPDLQEIQNQIGVEVTIAETSKTMETQRLYSTLHDVDDITRSKHIKRIEQCGATYENGILLGPDGSDDFTLINHAVDSKVEKLQNGGYEKFSEYHLFIFSSILASETMLKDELRYLEQRGIDDYFKKIYIQIPRELLYFDLVKSTYEVFSVDTGKQFERQMKARQMVEDGESQ